MVYLTDIFRSIFGQPKERFFSDDLPRNIQEDFESLYEGGSDLHWQQHPPTSGEEWSISIPRDGEHNLHVEIIEGDFLREFDQLFQSFFRGFPMDFTPPLQGPPTVELPPDLPSDRPQESFRNHSGSLRDRMLIGPDSSPQPDNFEHQHEGSQSEGLSLLHPFSLFGDLWRVPFGRLTHLHDQQVDRDLDSEVEMGNQSLDDILGQTRENQTQQRVPHSSVSSSSFSSVTIVDSNGVTEQRTTKRNSTGKEEVTMTRKIGDQTHTITQRKDENGNEETQEDLVNIDTESGTKVTIKRLHREPRHTSRPQGLEEFNEKWHHSKHTGKYSHLTDGSSSRHTPLSSICESLLEQFFPKR